ncbi:MAG: HEPN domain-containing protein [Thermoplasmatota archaeon]
MTSRTKTRDESHSKAKTYWEKAQRFARAAREARDSANYDPALSSAINAVVNVVDAICVHYLGKRSASTNHEDALQVLQSIEPLDSSIKEQLRKRLGSLLSKKALAQYEAALVTRKEAEDGITDMDRAFTSVASFAKAQGWG